MHGIFQLSFKEYRSRRSQKVVPPSSSTTTTLPSTQVPAAVVSAEQFTHVPTMPVSPAQKINEAASLLLTPQTVSLTNFERNPTPPVPGCPGMEMFAVTASSQEPVVHAAAVVTNGVSLVQDANHLATPSDISGKTVGDGETSNNACGENNALLLEAGDGGGIGLGELVAFGVVAGPNTSFEAVSSENEYDSESPVDESGLLCM